MRPCCTRIARHGLIALGLCASPAIADELLDQGFAATGLPTPVSLAASHDDRHLYVVDASADTISIFAHDPNGPNLTLLDTEPAPLEASSPRSIVISPDDRSVFVSSDTDAVIAYERDPATGALTLINVAVDGSGDVTGLVDPTGMAVSPGGEFLYVAADGALVVLTIAQDGAISFYEAQQDGVEGVTGLAEGRAVALSRDGRHVYVSAAGPPGQLVFFRRNPGETRLEFVGADYLPAPIQDAFDLLVSRDGNFVYLGIDDNADPALGARVASFARDTTTGTPAFLDENGTNGVFPLGLIERRDGLGLYAADSEQIVPLRFDPFSGTLGLVSPIDFGTPGLPVNGVPKLAQLADTLYVADIGNDRLQRFGVAPLLADNAYVPAGLDGAASVVVSPDGRHVYITGSADDAVTAFSRPSRAELDSIETERDGVNGVEGLNGADGIAVSPDGKHLYVAGTLDHSIAIFTRDANAGGLGFAGVVTDGAGGVDGLAGIDKVVVSPDGKHVYASGGIDDAVAVFGRNATTGALSFVEREKDGEGGVSNLDNPQGLALSPDGAHLYVAAFFSGAVVRFDRNATTGALTFAGFNDTGFDNSGLQTPEGVTVLPDGTAVFLATGSNDEIHAFQRDRATGALSWRDDVSDPSSSGLQGVNFLATSRDGRYVIAAARDSGAVSVFRWDGTAHRLTQVQAQFSGSAVPLAGARGIGVGPGVVYATAGSGDAVVVFVPEPAASLLGTAALGALAGLGRRRRGCARSAAGI